MRKLFRIPRTTRSDYTPSEWFEAVSEAVRQPVDISAEYISFSKRIGLQIPLVQAGRRAARQLLGAKTPVAVYIEPGPTLEVKLIHLPPRPSQPNLLHQKRQ